MQSADHNGAPTVIVEREIIDSNLIRNLDTSYVRLLHTNTQLAQGFN